MADDPNRDLLPVKEGCRQVCGPQKLKPTNSMSVPSYSTFGEDSKDLQQRHYVTKLDRDELEDRFLRMMEDHTQMKKKCNAQEEKIKRLATKLLRIVSDRDRAMKSVSDRRDHHAVERLDEMQARINDLESCNQQLQERVIVLKTQLGTHSKLHASVHYNPSSQSPSRSGCRSRPCSRTGLGPDQDTMMKRGCDSWDQQGESKGSEEESLRRKVKHLEQEIASMQEQHRAKISQLEQQVSYLSAEEQRHRAAENIEMIRLKREMKTQAMQMEAVRAQSNESDMELERVRCALQDCQSDNCHLSRELGNLKTSNLDLMEQLSDAKGKSENSRDLKNQVTDLQREQQSLKAQNNQLLQIASKTICTEQMACDCPADGSPQSQRSGNSANIANEDPKDLQDMYEEMQKIRDLSSSQECYDTTCTGNDDMGARNMGAYQPGYTDVDENNLLEPSSTSAIDGKDSHERAHNRLCTCDVKNRKSYFPPCLCGCSLCTQAQLSKKGPVDTQARRSLDVGSVSPITEYVSEQYVRQQDLASCSNQCSKGEILEDDECGKECTAGCSSGRVEVRSQAVLSASSVKQRSSNSPDSQGSNGYGVRSKSGRIGASSKSIDDECGKECTDVCSSGRVDNRSNAGLSASSVKQRRSSSPDRQGSNGNAVRSKSGRIGGSSKLIDDPCGTECVDVCSSSRVEVRSNAGSPTLTGRQESPGCSSTCSGTSEGLSRNQNSPPKKSQLSVRSPTKDNSRSRGCMPAEPSASSVNQADILHELEVCKELLRVQCSLNASFKNELTKLYAEIAKLEGTTSSTSINVSNSLSNESKENTVSPSQDGMRRKSLLRVGEGEGLFEIHAHCIELSDEGSIQIPANRGMFLTWTFYDQDVAYTPLKTGPKAEINTSAVYRVLVNNTFLDHLHTEVCSIELHASKDDSSELVARGTLKFSEILDFPQNKLHSSVRLLSVKPCGSARTLGMLQCWFRLSCELSIIDKYNEGRVPSPKSYESPGASGTEGLQVKPEEPSVKSKEPQADTGSSGSEPVAGEESLPFKTSSAKQLNDLEVESSAEEVPEVVRSSTKDSLASSAAESKGSIDSAEVEEAEYRKKMEEDASSKVSDATPMSEIINEANPQGVETQEDTQERDELQRQIMAKLDKVALEQKSMDSLESELDLKVDGPLALTIEIHTFTPDLTLEFYKKSHVVQVYIEFKFLGLSGPELETRSVNIASGTLVYNYKKIFNYSAADQQKMLADMYEGTTWHDCALQFVVVSEPHEDESTELDCEEIGYADVDLKQLIGRGRDLVKSDVVVYGSDGAISDLGKLNISILGVKTCRKAVHQYLKDKDTNT